MKVIFLNRFFFPDHSATSQLLTDLAFHLSQRGLAVHVITARQLYDGHCLDLPRTETINGVVIHRVWTTGLGRSKLHRRTLDYISYYLGATWCLFMLVSRGDVIVAKTDPPLLSLIAWPCARLRRASLVNWLQDIFPEVAQALGVRLASGSIGWVLRKSRNLSLNGAAQNIVLGQRMANYLLSQGIKQDKIRVVPNWADGESIKPIDPAKNSLRHQWHLENKFIVGYSGNLGRTHDVDTIVGAAETLSHISNIVFLIIGGGNGKIIAEEKACAKGLKNILFKPYQPRDALGVSLTLPDVHLVSLLPEMEGFIVPSKFYGIAAAGKPIIFIGAMDGDLATVIAQSACGTTVSPGDVTGLAREIRRLSESPVDVHDMGCRNRNLFESKYDKKHAFLEWELVLGNLLTNRSK